MLKRAVAYTALALSVTVGGVIIGATVIAPAVGTTRKATAAPTTVAAVDAPAAVAAAPTAPAGPNRLTIVTAQLGRAIKSARTAIGARISDAYRAASAFVATRRMPELPANVWLAIGVSCTVVVLTLVGWRIRARRVASRGPVSSPLMVQTNKPTASIVIAASTKLPGMSAVSSRLTGRIDRTPRAVVALAESGAAPAEIAKRTGMPLDAVAMCLSMYQMGVRQLQPPTA